MRVARLEIVDNLPIVLRALFEHAMTEFVLTVHLSFVRFYWTTILSDAPTVSHRLL